ncbi:amidase domain-containing protein, partial [Clostridium paraputrificum]
LIDYKRMVRTSNSLIPFRGSNYNSKLASEYAQKHALNYNTKYKSFDTSGGDCTNFVSQCLHAGNIPITNSWRPYSTSWIRVNELYNYLIKNGIGVDITSKHPYKEGDVIQFYANSKGYFSHSGVITKALGYGEYLYCCHSYDKLNFPLSEIFPFMYDKIRVIQPK